MTTLEDARKALDAYLQTDKNDDADDEIYFVDCIVSSAAAVVTTHKKEMEK